MTLGISLGLWTCGGRLQTFAGGVSTSGVRAFLSLSEEQGAPSAVSSGDLTLTTAACSKDLTATASYYLLLLLVARTINSAQQCKWKGQKEKSALLEVNSKTVAQETYKLVNIQRQWKINISLKWVSHSVYNEMTPSFIFQMMSNRCLTFFCSTVIDKCCYSHYARWLILETKT